MSAAAQTILVTGAAGFIGSAVAARLAAMGHRVTGCDNFNDYYTPQLKHDRVAGLLSPAGVECRAVELADEAQVCALFDSVKPDLVVHLAAQAGVRYSIDNPSAYVQSNLVAFGHMLEACKRGQVGHLLYASSSSVYGANARLPFSEDDQADEPVSMYAATKKANELMAHSYSHLFKLPATGLRFFTVYGPWGRPDMAYFSFAQKMLRGDTIPVFAGGQLTRDFTYVDDIVEGVVRLLFKPTPAADGKAPHTVFNIGNHQPVMVLDFINTLEKVLGVEARKEFLPMQAGDVPATFAAIDKLRDWVGFAPTTSLEAGLTRFRDWFLPWNAKR
jgi:UDP-glucuronate 4-epimerase